LLILSQTFITACLQNKNQPSQNKDLISEIYSRGGSFSTYCINVSGDNYISRIVLQDGVLYRYFQFYDSADCLSGLQYSIYRIFEYSIPSHSDFTKGADNIDLIQTNYGLIPHTETMVNDLANMDYCKNLIWNLEKPTELSGVNCYNGTEPSNLIDGKTHYTIIKITDTTLQIGIFSSAIGTTKFNRGQSFSPFIFYKTSF
jgi:hypothetical protein